MQKERKKNENRKKECKTDGKKEIKTARQKDRKKKHAKKCRKDCLYSLFLFCQSILWKDYIHRLVTLLCTNFLGNIKPQKAFNSYIFNVTHGI